MKVTVIQIVICALGKASKGLEREVEDLEIEGRVKTIQTTEYWEESCRLEKTCCHLDFKERLSANAGAKNSPKVI